MSLRYILGGVGCGKTQLCINEIMEKDNHKNKLLYIVPEQFSMESERALLRAKKSIVNTGVYSFRHLSFVIMQSFGVKDNNVLDDIGRSMLLQKVLIDVKEDLGLYKKSLNQQGFINSLSSTISELMQYNVKSENIADASKSLSECNLKYKLLDIEKIYNAYLDKLKSKYVSAENTLDILTPLISKSDMIKGSEIWIDGFKSFTPQEYRVIAELLKYAKNVNVALTTDGNTIYDKNLSSDDMFYETKNTIKRLNEIAKDNNVIIEKPEILSVCYRYGNNKELSILSSEYISQKNTYEYPCQNINICRAKNKYEEIEFVCSKIIELTRDNAFRYDQIAVIAGSSDYEKPLCSCLNRYNIPNFLDSRCDIAAHPLTQTITAALEIISDSFSIDSVFSFLKSPFVNIEEDNVFLLENYAVAQNIKGRRWFIKDWKYGFDDKTYTKPLIENTRDAFLNYISPLSSKIKRGKAYPALEITNGLFTLLEGLNIEDSLNYLIDLAIETNDKNTVAIHNQIWKQLCAVFEKMSEFLGDEKVTVRDYLNILRVGLEAATMGVIPGFSDYLIIGDIERTRLPEIKALFILGVNEGVLPPQRTDAGIFTDNERAAIKYNFFELAPELRLRLAQDNLNIYMAITKPSQYLYLTYSTGGISGEEMIKSPVINKIENIFTGLEEYIYDAEKPNITAPVPSLNKLIDHIKNNNNLTEEEKAMYKYFNSNDKYKYIIKNIKYILENTAAEYLPIEIADEAYPDLINISVSKLESFSKCPYSFFLKYTLYAKEKNEYQFKSLESGNIYHAALEYVFNVIKDENIDLADLSSQKEEIQKLASSAIDSAVIQEKSQHLVEVPRYEGFINRMKKILATTIWSFSHKAKKDEYKPREFEFIFDEKKGIPPVIYELEKGKSLKLTGKIDRIDHRDSIDKIYIRIVDYKSGNYSIDFNNIYHGVDIQLPFYINAYINSMSPYYKKELVPGEVLYYKIVNPQINKNNEDISQDILSNMKYNGIVLNDTIISEGSADIIKAEFSFNEDDFKKLNKFIDKKIIDCGNEIAKGNIAVKPYRYINGNSTSSGCDYCSYKTICKISLKEKEKYNNYINDVNILNKVLMDDEN